MVQINNSTISFWQLINKNAIEIPAIQRDYAQGKIDAKIEQIRNRFLDALFYALHTNGKILELDFIYGFIKVKDTDQVVYVPLDGQQRLTTLYLLHWYVAFRNTIDAKDNLSKFSYATRHSSQIFCEQLVGNSLQIIADKKISENIKNQKWFFTSWQLDPTIVAMLNMLDCIEERYDDKIDYWLQLTGENASIQFYNLPMDKFGLSDDLYIKMNSRGKALTEFEYIKSIIPNYLPLKKISEFNIKIDTIWSDMFWSLYSADVKSKNLALDTDSGTLRFLSFLSTIHNYTFENDHETHNNEQPIALQKYSNPSYNDFFFSVLDEFSNLDISFSEYFDSLFYIDYEEFSTNKTRLFFQSKNTNLLKLCCDNYSSLNDENRFVAGEQLLLFAVILDFNKPQEDIAKKIRLLRNLIAKSPDYMRKENIKQQLLEVKAFIIESDLEGLKTFNKYQIEEEHIKWNFRKEHPDLVIYLNQLEDHIILQGCLKMFNFDNTLPLQAESFIKLFENDKTEIAQIMFTIGDYKQYYNESWWRIGSKSEESWETLFTPSERRKGIENTKLVLNDLLLKFRENSFSFSNMNLSNSTSSDKVIMDWRYYLIKYPLMLRYYHDAQGYFYWRNPEESYYELFQIRKTTTGSFHANVFLIQLKEMLANKKIDFEHNYGQALLIKNKKCTLRLNCVSNGFLFTSFDNKSVEWIDELTQKLNLLDGVLIITQDQNGIDLEDRIEKGIKVIRDILI
jgi:hypothetical protein